MKIIKQIGIIFTICWLSQVLEYLLPFAFPSSVLGLILLLIALLTGVLRLEHIQEKSDFLLSNMAFFFIPAGVSMMNYFQVFKSTLIPFLVIIVLTTIFTFGVTVFSIRVTVKFMQRRNIHERTL